MTDPTTNTLVDSLLEIIKTKPLKKVTISELLTHANVSRTAFSKRFSDLEDLICFIWSKKIIENSWEGLSYSKDDYYLGCLISFKRYLNFEEFMKQALEIRDQNCLSEFMVDYSMNFEKDRLRNEFTKDQLSDDEIQTISAYHAHGIVNLLIDWINGGMKTPPIELAKKVVQLRYSLSEAMVKNPETYTSL